jgi:hypothetical protein
MLLHNLCGDIDLLTPHKIKLDGAEQITLSSPLIYLESVDGGDLWLAKVGSDDMYFTHSGSGDIFFNHSGTGVIKFESKKNMSINSLEGTIFAQGSWKFDIRPYVGLDEADNRLTTIDDVNTLLGSYATASWVSSNFATASDIATAIAQHVIDYH